MSESVELLSCTKLGSIVPSSQTILYQAFENKNYDEFVKALNQEECDPNYLYDKANYMYLLDLCAASESQEYEQYAAVLIERGANFQTINQIRGKYPIHFAAEANNLPMLKLLVKYAANINEMDSFGSSALHILARKKEGHEECLKFILEQPELDLNMTNRRGQTAIHGAALTGAEESVKILLEQGSKLDLDSSRIGPGKKTAREVILEKYPDLKDHLPQDRDSIPKEQIKMNAKQLFTLLYSKEEKRFCEAFEKEMEDKAQKSLLTATDGLQTMLQYSAFNGLYKATASLLESNADPNFTCSANQSTPGILACEGGHVDILKLLLKQNGQDRIEFKSNSGDSPLHIVVKKGEIDSFYECLLVLLRKVKLDINAQDLKGNTALHYAVKYGNEKCVLALLSNGAYIGVRNEFDELPISHMTCETLKKHLDSCLSDNGELPREDSYFLSVDYKFLKPNYKATVAIKEDAEKGLITDVEETNKALYICETEPLLYISEKSDLKRLLTHPVFTSFIFLKWQRVSLFFYLNLLFYGLFCIFLTTYVLWKKPISFIESSNTSNDDNTTKSAQNGTVDKEPVYHAQYLLVHDIVRGVLIVITAALIVRELFQLVIGGLRKYLLNFENCLEILLLSVTTSLIVLDCNRLQLCPQLGSIAILASWFELVLLIGKHPLLSLNIEMFRTVSVSFLKFLAWYAILIVAFALSFFTLFRDCTEEKCSDNVFSEAGNSVFKTIVMLTGEFEAGDIPFVYYFGTSHIIFVLFVFLIAIVLFNLLNGLAVSDTQAIRDDALLYSYISRVKLIAYLEKMLLGDPLPIKRIFNSITSSCCTDISEEPIRPFCFTYFADRIVFFPYFIPNSQIYIYPNNKNKIEFNESRSEFDSKNCCSFKCNGYYLDKDSVRLMQGLIKERVVLKIENSHVNDQLLEQIEEQKIKLETLQNQLDAQVKASEQNQKLLIQILAILSLNNANNEN